MSFQPVVEVEDSNGNPVTTDLSPVLLQISALSGSGSISGCTGLENKGYVAFSNCTISASGTYDIYATDNSLPAVTGASNCPTNWAYNCQNSNYLPIALTGQGYSLVFYTEPLAGVSGAIMTQQPVVHVVSSSNLNQLCSTCTGTVNLASSGGTLTTSGGNCASIPIVGGVAAASGCYFAGGYKLVANGNYQATQYVLIATATGDVTGESTAFGVSKYGSATQLSFYVQPIGTASSSASSPFLTQPVTIANTSSPNSQAVVALEDSFGNVVVNQQNSGPATVNITLGISSGESIHGCTIAFSNGYYFVTNCYGSAWLNGVTLTATASATSGFIPPPVTSNPFNITHPATQSVFTIQPVLAEISRDFPDADLLGIDLSAEFASRFLERQRAGEFGGAYVHFFHRNLFDRIFEPDSIDTTLCNSTLHEIWSYGEGEKSVRSYLAEKFRQLRPGGRLLIRDVVGPDDGDREVLLWCSDTDGQNPEQPGLDRRPEWLHTLSTRSRFHLFARDFLGGRGGFSFTETRHGQRDWFRLSLRQAAEFLSKKDYTDNWSSEMNEAFCSGTFPNGNRRCAKPAFKSWNPPATRDGSRVYTNPWIVEQRHAGHVELAGLDGRPLPWPPTNMILVAGKPVG